jgi:peroxiredoxin Q/BCP
MVKEGDNAPDFTLETTEGTITLSALRGAPVVLYFYPKDDTSGCTAEASQFRDAMPSFAGAKVIGVSPDSVDSHDKFSNRYDLNFALAADPAHKVAEQYGVWVEKSMYGRNYMGIERTTFVIDGDGVVRKAFHKVKVPGHHQEVLKALKTI